MEKKENVVKKVKIVKSEYANEKLLENFYNYLRESKIEEVEDVKNADLIISLGGDGTMLKASKEAIVSDTPILAINLGSLGYLVEINPENAVEMKRT